MSVFNDALSLVNPSPENRRWIYVPYDQLGSLNDLHTDQPPESTGLVLIENVWKPSQRPYHKQKLALILSNMRNFAIEQARQGVCIRYVTGNARYSALLEPIIAEMGEMSVSTPAERELREDLQPLVDKGMLKVKPHRGWVTGSELFRKSVKSDGRFRMDAFYRLARQKTGILMIKGKPVGGKYSFDSDNRRPWKGSPKAPQPPFFSGNDITDEVCELVDKKFGAHPGKINRSALPSTAQDAHRLWSWAKQDCLENFGPYEDAMSSISTGLFHTRVSALLNMHRLSPRRLIGDVESLDITFSSKEGFIRQVLGWREFVRHCHESTDGFRSGFQLDDSKTGDRNCENYSGKGGPAGWRDSGNGSSPNFMDSFHKLPPAYWGRRSGFTCLDSVVSDVWNEAYSHHITRLMILCNFGALLDICPRQLTDWFWIAYQDAYDWVVEPNVFGMGLFAVGDLMTTKPYVAGSAYINRMSDYCGACAFSPGSNCPVTNLYWAYLERHRERLEGNVRMGVVMSSLSRRDYSIKQYDLAVFLLVSKAISQGETLKPQTLENLKRQGHF